MMDAYREALKRKMEAMKKPMNDHDGDESTNGNKEASDLAPARAMEAGDANHMAKMTVPPVGDGGHEAIDPDHLKVLEALADGGHSGHGPSGSLHAKVADKAKEKFASIQKHKHGV